MRMIPSVLLRTDSRAEAKLFRILQDTSLSDAWTAYHSLNCSEHAYKNWAEIDFLIAGPDAILVLEVKGGRVRCKDGIWIYTDRFGRSRKSAEGPYRQASTAMYALRALLSDRYKLDVVASGRIPFGFGVVFPDIDWDIDTPECPAGITADRLMVAKPAYAAMYVKHLVAYWRGKQAVSSTLTDTELRQIRDRLRPDVDVYPPLSQGLGAALTELQHLTEEQYERLELIEQNDRAIVTGGAGTGKTFLLMQYARRCAARGLRVSIVAHSPLLAAHLRKGIDDPAISIASIKHLNTELREPADVLLVDEGQDLMNIDALADLSAFVKGGLDDGRWCWFMDDNNQSGVVGRFDLQALAYLQTGLATGKPVKLPLRRNCRNTKEIVRQVQLWTGADIGITEVSGFGNRPQAVAVLPQEAGHELARRVKDCLDGGAEPGDVGIVIEDDTEPAQFRELPAAIRRLLTPLTVASVATNLKGRIVWGSAAQFKGLERPIVFVLALEDTNTDGRQGALYVGLTRANYGLCVLASPRRAALLADAHRRHLPLVQLPGDRPMIALRDKVLNRIKADLFGPGGGEDEVVIGRPYWRYLCGMLFPSSVASVDLEEDDEKDARSVATGDEQSDPAIALAYDALPSSMGISFFLSGANVLSCRVQGARYEPDPGTADRWVRRPLGTPVCPTQVELEVPRPGVRETHEQHIWEGRARIAAVFRPRANGHLATVSLVNAQNAPGGGPGRQIAQMLFQCQFAVYLPDGSIGEYPTIARYSRHEEDEELAVSYRNRKTYGIGHGCAASWAPATTAIDEIKADPLPRFEVRGLTTSISLPEPAGRCLEIRWLADPSTPRVQLRDAVEAMVDSYREWVNDQEATMATLNETEANPATRMVQRQRTAIARMRKGIATLFGADESVLKAFRIAQEAMLRQFLWVARRKSPKDAGEGDITPMDPWVRLEDSPSWRPFQLAFQLVVLQSLADPDSPDRDVLDLLWFPTGGGKTEAYLALAAFEIALRRVRHGEAGAGTAVLMRYTLRLLTAQQFERAATVVCVLEAMRRERPELGLGDGPFASGFGLGANGPFASGFGLGAPRPLTRSIATTKSRPALGNCLSGFWTTRHRRIPFSFARVRSAARG